MPASCAFAPPIGAGAQQQVIAFIEQLGVRNLIVEARESVDNQVAQRVRKLSAGLTFRDLRVIQDNVQGLAAVSPRKRFLPGRMLPKPYGDMPTVYGVSTAYQQIANLVVTNGRFFDAREEHEAAAVAVLGQGAAATLFGVDDPVGKFVKVNEDWFRVIGVAGPQLAVQENVGGLPAQDRNNLIYVPTMAAVLRIEDARSYLADEIDAVYISMKPDTDVVATGKVVRSLLDSLHRGAGDFSVIVLAELLAEQQRTKRLFGFIMVAIASISLLVGGIGIMNIMLASVMERTREIGIRRAVGAKRRDIVRQFLIETTIISLAGGVMGVIVGVALSQVIGYLAGWSTIVTTSSIVLAFFVSVTIGLVFGLYPAARAARLDPVKALHYE